MEPKGRGMVRGNKKNETKPTKTGTRSLFLTFRFYILMFLRIFNQKCMSISLHRFKRTCSLMSFHCLLRHWTGKDDLGRHQLPSEDLNLEAFQCACIFLSFSLLAVFTQESWRMSGELCLDFLLNSLLAQRDVLHRKCVQLGKKTEHLKMDDVEMCLVWGRICV